jgi:hypothetical protein
VDFSAWGISFVLLLRIKQKRSDDEKESDKRCSHILKTRFDPLKSRIAVRRAIPQPLEIFIAKRLAPALRVSSRGAIA